MGIVLFNNVRNHLTFEKNAKTQDEIHVCNGSYTDLQDCTQVVNHRFIFRVKKKA